MNYAWNWDEEIENVVNSQRSNIHESCSIEIYLLLLDSAVPSHSPEPEVSILAETSTEWHLLCSLEGR